MPTSPSITVHIAMLGWPVVVAAIFLLMPARRAMIASVVAESTLSFFGFGPQPGQDNTSLGNLVQLSGEAIGRGDWWLTVFPCGALVLLAICINFIGDGLRDALDPKLDSGK